MEIPVHTFSYFVKETIEILKNLDKNIWQYIGHYLHKHNELCLQGMGRFATQVHGFSVDPISKKIVPGYKKIYFQVGDFETSPQFLAFVSAILDQSEIFIVDNIKLILVDFVIATKENQKQVVENFGVFKFNVMGELVFESGLDLTFNDQTFGLKPVHFAANLLKTKRLVVEEQVQEDQELTEMRESSLKELKVLLDNARISESTKPKKGSKLFPIVATTLTFILLINLGFFLINGPVSQFKQQISQMSLLGNTAQIIDSQLTETANVKIAKPVQPMIQKDTVELVQPCFDSIAAHIGYVFAKGNDDFDSNTYSIQAPILAEPIINATVNESTPIPTAQVIEEPFLNSSSTDEIVTDMPNMVSVDASDNGIEKGFYVITGAFKNEKNANKLREKLIKNGNATALVIKPASHPCYLVSYQKNTTLNQALNQLEQKQEANPSIWVYCAY